MSVVNVVADIGGTNIRLAISQGTNQTTELVEKKCADYENLQSVVQSYLIEKSIDNSDINLCLAIACPVENDLVIMTNLPWQFSKQALIKDLGLKSLHVINDYTAIAFAVPFLGEQQKVKIGGGDAQANKPISICGPGTGLGVGHLVASEKGWSSISCEGGHVDFAPVDEAEIAILQHLQMTYDHVSYEQLLSGLGLVQIYQALAKHLDLPDLGLQAHQISEQGLTQDCPLCEAALKQFCKTLGSFAGNLALTAGSFGGVYIAGGIVPRFIDFFGNSEFRDRFEAKGRLSTFNCAIPTYVITESQPGVLGAAAYLEQQLKEEL